MSETCRRLKLLPCAIFLLSALASPALVSQDGSDAPEAVPPVAQIIQQMVQSNAERAARLRGYTDRRQYQVVYSGFPANLSARMTVEATFEAPSTKQFHIVAESGSKLLRDNVLKKLLENEKQAAQNPGQTALTPANYKFDFVREEVQGGRRCYVLQVEPRTDSKYLYRGVIWVDAQDFAVVQIQAEPAKNPSFWIKGTKIHHVYAKTGDFWLPAHNRSETKVWFGGTAVLTIDYGVYTITK